MKNLTILVVAALFATTALAQDSKSEKKAEVKSTHECYAMKDGALNHCTGDKAAPIKADVKLKNGTTISPEGVLKTQDGVSTKLENGQCVSLMGSVGDCDEMHAMMKEEHKMSDDKMK